MKNKNINKKILPVLLCMLLIVGLFPVQTFAVRAIDPNQDATLTIDYSYDTTPISGAQFDIYHVATISTTPKFTITADFADYPINVEGLDAAGWNDLALTLKGYVQKDNLKPVNSGKTDASGNLSFTMKPGLYLVVGNNLSDGGYSYTCTPSVVCLPDIDTNSNSWSYGVTIKPKARRDTVYTPSEPEQPVKPSDPTEPVKPSNPGSDSVTMKVMKVWEDHGYTSEIPKKVMITLLCDGQDYETVTLNQKNNWRYTWEGLEHGHDWSVVEKEIKGYTVKVTQENRTFVVTNTSVKTPATPNDKDNDKLPQTGMLWWPVPLLLIGGVVFVAIGIRGRRKRSDA